MRSQNRCFRFSRKTNQSSIKGITILWGSADNPWVFKKSLPSEKGVGGTEDFQIKGDSRHAGNCNVVWDIRESE